MRKFQRGLIGVEQGTEILFSHYASGGEMWTGEGPREIRKSVTFSEAFASPPVVQLSFWLWDMDKSANIRADLSSENVTETGFEIVFRTWGDTKVARMRADWTAMGEVAGEDDWVIS